MRYIEFHFHTNVAMEINAKIKAIKALRASTPLGLKLAKDLVEEAIEGGVRVRMSEGQFGLFIAAMLIDNVPLNLGGARPTYHVTKVVVLNGPDPDIFDVNR